MTDKRLMKGLIAISCAVLIWGSNFVVKVELLNKVSAFTVVYLQTIGALIILLAYIFIKKKKIKMTWDKIMPIAVSGILGMGLYQLFLNFAISKSGAVVASLVTSLLPAMCIIVDTIIFKYKIKAFNMISIGLSFCGVFFIVALNGRIESNLIGLLMLILSNIVWIIYCYFNNKNDKSVDKSIYLFYQVLGCAIVLTPLLLFRDSSDFITLGDINLIWRIVYLALFNSVLSFVLFTYASNVLSVVSLNMFNNGIPIVTIILNFIIYGEKFNILQLAGIIMVFASIIIDQKGRGKELNS